MNYLLYIAILPVILLCSYIYKKDKVKEPGKLLRKIFIFGCLSTIPIIIIELVLDRFFPTENVNNLYMLFINVCIGVALVEEFFKWLVVYVITFRNKEFDHRYDAILYMVFSSLAFAVVENIMYVFDGGVGTAVARAFTAIPSHAIDAVIMGYFYGLSKDRKVNNKPYIGMLLASILVPTLTHGVYDYLIFAFGQTENFVFLLVFLIFVISTFIISFIIVKKVSKVDTNFDGTFAIEPSSNIINDLPNTANETVVLSTTDYSNMIYCKFCGKPIDKSSNFCTHCGNKLN